MVNHDLVAVAVDDGGGGGGGGGLTQGRGFLRGQNKAVERKGEGGISRRSKSLFYYCFLVDTGVLSPQFFSAFFLSAASRRICMILNSKIFFLLPSTGGVVVRKRSYDTTWCIFFLAPAVLIYTHSCSCPSPIY